MAARAEPINPNPWEEPPMSGTADTVPPPPIDPADHAAKETIAPAEPGLVREVMRAASRPIARRNFFSDVPDKGLFLLFALGGFGATFAAKFSGFTGLPSALAALAALCTYALVSYRIEWFRLHPDRLGDNCYYMGFLFTLASLSAALVNIDTHTGGARDELLEGLIGSFGVALFSTIGGITLRVVFMQLRREVEDVEEAIRNELQDAARHLKDQLGDAVQNLEAFRTRTMQVMDEQLASAADQFTKASKTLAEHVVQSGAAHAEAAERLTEGAEKATSDLTGAAKTIATQMQAAGTSHRKASERLTESSERVVEEIRRLVERVDKVDIPSDLLTRQVEAARAQLVALVSSLQEAANRDTERQAVTERAAATLDQLLQRMSEFPAFEAVERSVDRLGTGAEAAAVAMERASETMGAHASAIGSAAAQAQRDGAAIATARLAIEADLKESTAALHKLQGSLASVAENLAAQLGG
jgi:hypothetical protein